MERMSDFVTGITSAAFIMPFLLYQNNSLARQNLNTLDAFSHISLSAISLLSFDFACRHAISIYHYKKFNSDSGLIGCYHIFLLNNGHITVSFLPIKYVIGTIAFLFD